MKKTPLWFVSLVVSVTLLFSGCALSRTSSNEVVATAIELADSYMALGDVSSALDVYDRAIFNSRDYRLLYNKAYCLACSGLFYDAGVLCEKSFEEFHDRTDFLKAGAVYYEKAGFYEKSLSCLETLLSLDEEDKATRRTAMEKAIAFDMNDKAYSHALILWDQMVYEKDIAAVLYANDMQRWQAVYDYFN